MGEGPGMRALSPRHSDSSFNNLNLIFSEKKEGSLLLEKF
jgi:hypothetical protein